MKENTDWVAKWIEKNIIKLSILVKHNWWQSFVVAKSSNLYILYKQLHAKQCIDDLKLSAVTQ